MAEGLLSAALIQEGLDEAIEVGSAGVAAMPGQEASRDTRTVLKKRGAELISFKSRQADEELLGAASLVIAMTSSHADLVKRFFPECAGYVRLLCDFLDPDEDLSGADVPDPIGMGRAAYEEVADVIDLALPGIISELEKLND